MAEIDRSLTIYGYWRESAQRFDYFITGLIGAVIAFLGKSYTPNELGFNSSSLELVTFIVWIIAFFCAFKRIELSIHLNSINVSLEESISFLEKLIDKNTNEPKTSVIDTRSGVTLNPNQIESQIQYEKQFIENANAKFEKNKKKVRNLYSRRNYLMIFGMLLFFIAKVLKAYSL